ncbi:MAG: hypothetical protein RR145_02165 [Oscillospiraceae bacterium]
MKKVISSIVLIFLMVGLCSTCVMASSDNYVKLSGIYETFQTIKIKSNLKRDEIKSYKWLLSADENGSYAPIPGAENFKFTVNAECANKWLKVEITSNTDEVIASAPRKIGEIWGKQPQINGNDDKLTTVNKKTPPEYLFTVDGQEFILLDATESDDGRFLVYAKNVMGVRKFNVNGGQTFDEMAGYLNNEFLTKGSSTGQKLPTPIIENIFYDNTWKIEEKMWEDTTERGVKGGVALLSAHELKQYCSKIGLYEDQGKAYWLRTPLGPPGDGNHVLCTSSDEPNTGLVFTQNSMTEQGIRPIFYLNKNFFANVKIDTATMGSDVAKTIRENYTKRDLMKLYTLQELEETFGFGDNYEITAAEFLGQNGTPLTALNQPNVTAKVNIQNSYENAEYVVLVAVYNNKNQLVNLDSKKTMLVSGNNIVNIDLKNIPETDGNYAKISLINNKAELMPEAKTFTCFK